MVAVQKMAWSRPGDKPSSEPMMVILPADLCVSRPQWVNLRNKLQWNRIQHIFSACAFKDAAHKMSAILFKPLWVQKYALQWRHNGRDSVSNHQPHDHLLNRLFRRRSKNTSKLGVTGLCAGNSPGTGEFPAQMASYAENVSIWWRHHGLLSHDLQIICTDLRIIRNIYCIVATSNH